MEKTDLAALIEKYRDDFSQLRAVYGAAQSLHPEQVLAPERTAGIMLMGLRERAEALDPESETTFLLGVSACHHLSPGHKPELLDLVLEIDWRFSQPVAETLLTLGEPKAALSYAQQALKQCQTDREKALTELLLGRVEARLGWVEEAERRFRWVLESGELMGWATAELNKLGPRAGECS